jgi:hypothetical protein
LNAASVGLLSAVIVAIVTFTAQVFLQRKSFISTLRQERREAFVDFLASANRGVRSVVLTRQLADAIRNNTLTGTESEKLAIRKQAFDSYYSYDQEIARSLALLQISCPRSLSAVGSELTEAINSYYLGTIMMDILDAKYDAFAKLANDHLADLLRRTFGFRSHFSTKFLDLTVETPNARLSTG